MIKWFGIKTDVVVIVLLVWLSYFMTEIWMVVVWWSMLAGYAIFKDDIWTWVKK